MFKNSANPFLRFGGFAIGAGLILAAWNAFNTATSLGRNPGVSFFELFFVVGTNASGNINVMSLLQVWGPVVLLPLGLVLLLVGFATTAAYRRRN